jgi:outer membrane protein OmpA-like peptidoglycan-associated protein
MHLRQIGRALLPVVAMVVLAATGCSAQSSNTPVSLNWVSGQSCPPATGGPVTLAVGARANSSAPQIPDAVNTLMSDAASAGNTIQVVRVDGSPSTAYSATFKSDAANDVARKNDLNTFLETTKAAIAGLKPKAPEADVLGALGEAARLTPQGGYVVLVDSGLQTKGLIRFQDTGTFSADPNDIVAYIKSNGQLPDLRGRSVILVGLGNTADPQPSLNNVDLRNKVTALWETVAESAGASCVAVVETPEVRRAVETDIPVTVVSVPQPAAFNPCGATELRDDGTVGFIPDSTDFRQPSDARSTLQPYADWLRDHDQARAQLVGYIAHYGDPKSSLSLRRAQKVRDTLIQLGANGDHITATGGGWGPHPSSSAPPDPAIDATNRMVVITIACA